MSEPISGVRWKWHGSRGGHAGERALSPSQGDDVKLTHLELRYSQSLSTRRKRCSARGGCAGERALSPSRGDDINHTV
ncbi:hypothetical protein H920_06174 [Fukomys damarensis]|uniref:Uncharacterized protein n=1 Tax=Fukomys damarensis TaxID=885580 RepID=A0A091EAY6_FUKDA|nr:hypothetical protein H920_06174 [Fukomys damarensis]